MRKTIFILFIGCSLLPAGMMAQSSFSASASASQTIQLELAPVISIQFKNTSSASGAQVNMAFNNIGQYNSGVISGSQELKIQSNKAFKISVQTDASSFSYTGNQAQIPSMPVSNTLSMSVTGNTTGGSVPSSFNNTYNPLSSSSQDVILNGQQGGDQSFVLAYKAKPDLGYPAGMYSVGVIYTATQP